MVSPASTVALSAGRSRLRPCPKTAGSVAAMTASVVASFMVSRGMVGR